LIVPCSAADGDNIQNESYHRRLQAQMVRRFPSLAEIPIEASWSGLYQETVTRVPIMRALASMPGVIANIGYGGVGVTLTQFSGRIAAGLVLGAKHRDHDAERMRAIYASTRIPIKEGMKFGWRLLRALLSSEG
jgi:glycine/D-amino acid oxidase-like deaminating enzyme